MNKDGCYTSIHMHQPRNAELFEDICKDRLPDDDIFVPIQYQPINPEDEDDVVPDQHAAFGIQKATQATREPAWKDLGLAGLMRQGPHAKGPGSHGPQNQRQSQSQGGSSGNTYAYYAYYYGYNGSGVVGGSGSGNGNDSGSGSGSGTGTGSGGGQAQSGRPVQGMPR